MVHATLLDRVAQRADDVLLPDDVCERAGAMTAVQRSGHGLSESSGEVGRLGLRAALLIPLGALLAWALVAAGFLNYDTAYSLLWGGDVAHLRQPDFSVPLAPTPHPLSTALGVVLTPFGDFGQTLWVVVAFLSLGALAWLTYELGAHWFGPWAGAVAALVILTRIPVLSFGVRAYLDIPYVALVLGAILAEARGRRAARSRSSCSASPACCGPRRGCSPSPTSPGSAICACCRSPRPRPSSGWPTTSCWPAIRCTRCSARATTRRCSSARPASAPCR